MKLLKNQKGQGLMEYLIITSLVGIISLYAMKQFGEVIKKRIQKAKAEIVKVIPN
jgi:Tfp pilus assembly protein PilE